MLEQYEIRNSLYNAFKSYATECAGFKLIPRLYHDLKFYDFSVDITTRSPELSVQSTDAIYGLEVLSSVDGVNTYRVTPEVIDTLYCTFIVKSPVPVIIRRR